MDILKEKYKFPIKLYTETDANVIDNQYELLKFLGSSESPKTFNLPVVELSALANLLGGALNVLYTMTIKVVHFRSGCSIYESIFANFQDNLLEE